jgi:Zn-dependent protease with chaperone function
MKKDILEFSIELSFFSSSFFVVILFWLVLFDLNPFFKILISIIVGLISSIVFLQMEEYDCDKFAAVTLRDIYGISQPSKILEKTLEKMPHEGLSDYTHPSAHKRVKNIIDNVDKNTSQILRSFAL